MTVMKRDLKIVGVMGSASEVCADQYLEIPRKVAAMGFHLLTGGGGGTMCAAAQAFVESRPPDKYGLSIGVLPGKVEKGALATKSGYPNEFVEVAIVTPLPSFSPAEPTRITRNHVNVFTPDLILALPGGAGTENEVGLAQSFGRRVFCVDWKPKQTAPIISVAQAVKMIEEL
jgi:predicted Rossmann-fold nucleotide-binding protein